MKKVLSLLLCTLFVLSFAACSKNKTENATTQETDTPIAQKTDAPATQQAETAVGTSNPNTVDNYTLGALVTINGETEFKLNGLRLDGNRSAPENNGKDTATTGIRSGFFLDERIEFYLDTDYRKPDSEDVKVLCVKHRPYSEYSDISFDSLLEEAAFTETFTEQPADASCFDPYVFSENFGEGNYDVLFTYKGEIVYYIVIQLTPETAS